MQVRHDLLRGAVAGAAATVAMSLLMIAAVVTGLSPMPEPVPKAVAGLLLGSAPKPALMGAAVLGHLAYGAVWGAVLLAVEPTPTRENGVALGLGLWVVMGTVVLPAVGWGLFGSGITLRIAAATFILHVVYGESVALAAGRLEPRTRDAPTAGSA